MTEKTLQNRWLVVLGAVLIQLSLGAIYAWSVFTPTLVAEGWTKVQTQIVFAVGLASFAVVMVWAGKKMTTWGPRMLALISGIVLGSGYALAGLLYMFTSSATQSFWLLTICIGLIGGAGIGLGYVVPIAVGMRWFPDKKGMITGLAVAGFGFGAMGWVKLAGAWGQLIETVGLSGTFIAYGAAFAVLIILGAKWMKMPPEGWTPDTASMKKTKPQVLKRIKDATDSQRVNLPKQEGYVGTQILKTRQFYMIFLTFVVSSGAGLMSIGLMKLYPTEALTASGMDPVLAAATAGTAMAVFFSLANGIGRIVWGTMSDKIGRRLSILIMASTQGFILIAFPAMAGNTVLLYLGATLIGFNFGGNFALFPAITADIFGTANVGRNYPFVFLAYGVGGIAGPILGGLLGDMGNFPLAFIICGFSCIFGAIAIATTSQPKASA